MVQRLRHEEDNARYTGKSAQEEEEIQERQEVWEYRAAERAGKAGYIESAEEHIKEAAIHREWAVEAGEEAKAEALKAKRAAAQVEVLLKATAEPDGLKRLLEEGSSRSLRRAKQSIGLRLGNALRAATQALGEEEEAGDATRCDSVVCEKRRDRLLFFRWEPNGAGGAAAVAEGGGG